MFSQLRRRTRLGIAAGLAAVSLAVASHAEKTKSVAVPQGQQGDKPVEQTRKNIQVLKGLPESQLTPLMNFVAVSLGVQCNYCHVSQGKDPQTGFTNWLWERDDKPEKEAARRMMKMVLAINASNPSELRQNSVTCYTCHRGQTTTVALPTMPVAKSGHEPIPNEPAPATPSIRPTVGQIFTKYLTALGGDRVASTTTLTMKGRREASQNRNWPTETTYAAPDKFLVMVTTPQALIRQSASADQGWILNGKNLRVMTPAEAVNARTGWEEIFKVVKVTQTAGMNFIGVQKINDRETHIIAKTIGSKDELYFFDSVTGLLVRKVTINHTALLPIPEQIDFEDYRDVDGIKMPFTIRFSGIDTFSSWTRTFTEIKRNAAVDESVFVKPVS